jgi:hypothetical protein
METKLAPVFVFDTRADAESAIQAVSRAGIDVRQLSLVGKGYHSEEHPIGFYTTGDRVKAWGAAGAFWGGIWGLLLAPAVFFLPGLGLVAMAGPITSVVVGALEGAVVVGGISALGAALSRIGVPKDQVVKYETDLKMDKYILIFHGQAADGERIRTVLQTSKLLEAA